MNGETWVKTAQFLAALNGENVTRSDYVMTPEYKEAQRKEEDAELKWEELEKELSDDEKRRLEALRDISDEVASAKEQRAYMQGYVDCIQILFHMDLLKDNHNKDWIKKI